MPHTSKQKKYIYNISIARPVSSLFHSSCILATSHPGTRTHHSNSHSVAPKRQASRQWSHTFVVNVWLTYFAHVFSKSLLQFTSKQRLQCLNQCVFGPCLHHVWWATQKLQIAITARGGCKATEHLFTCSGISFYGCLRCHTLYSHAHNAPKIRNRV